MAFCVHLRNVGSKLLVLFLMGLRWVVQRKGMSKEKSHEELEKIKKDLI